LDALACENTSLSHAGRFSDKVALDQVTKTQGDNAPWKTSVSKPLTPSTPRSSVGTSVQKVVNIASPSTQSPADQKVDNKKKGTKEDEDNKEILADPSDPDKKFKISSKLDPK
jgi:hypothetical protein